MTQDTEHTMKSLGRDMPLYHLFYSETSCSRSEKYIQYLTEDGATVRISEAVRVTDENSGAVASLLEEFRSRFPDGVYMGRGIWSSSQDIRRPSFC